MNTNMHDDDGRRSSLWQGPAMVTAFVLLIPLLGNHFVEGWNWRLRAFVLAGFVVFGTGLVYKLVTRNRSRVAYRAATGIALVATFVLVWGNFVQAADDINPAALMYLWVPLVEIVSACIARFRPRGMALALFITALAQALVLAIALLVRDPQVTGWTPPVLRGFGLNAFLVVVFSGSALLFRKAARVASAPAAE